MIDGLYPHLGRIGLFGGSFNPPHYGHLEISKIAYKKLKLDTIYWLVVPQNPFKKNYQYLPQKTRIDLCNNLIARDSKMRAIDFESNLKSFETFETVKKARRIFTTSKLFWIMGDDSFLDFHKWRKNKFIAQNTKLVIFNRGTMHKAIRTQSFAKYKPIVIWNRHFKISSTEIRNSLGKKWQDML